MNLRIYDEAQTVGDPDIYLRLVEAEDGIAVVACKENGEEYDCGYLLTFNTDGTFSRAYAVESTLGFSLCSGGRIKEV